MNIVITGASRGIGYELVKVFARDLNNTVYALSRNAEKLTHLTTACAHATIIPLPVDITHQPELVALSKDFPPEIDIVINNAGYLVNKPFALITPEELQQVYEVNVLAPFRLIQQLMPRLGKTTPSHIVNISSMGGFQGSVKFPGLSAYSSSKAAIAGLTECLAEELKEKNIVVNCLAIGAVQTEMLQEAFPGYQAPLSPSEMAAFIYDFALNGSRFFNGKILPVSLSTP